MPSRMVVPLGVVAGIFFALWFSTVVALGPAPGGIKGSDEAQRREAQEHGPKVGPTKDANKPHSSKHETYCSDAKEGKDRKDCIIALRNAEATERQAFLSLLALVLTGVAIALTAVGLVLIWLTLKSTRDAVVEAEKAAKAAQDSVEQTAEIGRHQSRDMQASIEVSRVSAASAAESNRLSQAFFAATERPWVKVNLTPGGPISYNVNGLNLTIRFHLANIGRSPARNVWINPTLFVPAIGIDVAYDSSAMQAAAIREGRSRGLVPMGHILFPGDTILQDYTMSTGQEELKRITTKVEFVAPVVYGYVSYGTTFDQSVHVTSFMVDVQRSKQARPESIAKNRAPSAIFPDEGEVPVAELRLMRSVIVSEYAD